MTQPVVRARKLDVTYPGGTQALKGVDLDIDGQGMLVILGRSGAGKSTLLRCINRLVKPTGGQLELFGDDITSLSGRSLTKVRARPTKPLNISRSLCLHYDGEKSYGDRG